MTPQPHLYHYTPLPLQVRDLYWTARNFRNRVSDFLRYRRVTANMDERFQAEFQFFDLCLY